MLLRMIVYVPSSMTSIVPSVRKTRQISCESISFEFQGCVYLGINSLQIAYPTAEKCWWFWRQKYHKKLTLFSGTALAMAWICTWSNSSSSKGSRVVKLPRYKFDSGGKWSWPTNFHASILFDEQLTDLGPLKEFVHRPNRSQPMIIQI